MAILMMPLSTVAPTTAHRIGYRRSVAMGMLLLAAGLGAAVYTGRRDVHTAVGGSDRPDIVE